MYVHILSGACGGAELLVCVVVFVLCVRVIDMRHGHYAAPCMLALVLCHGYVVDRGSPLCGRCVCGREPYMLLAI